MKLIDTFFKKISKKQNPSVVGLDPRIDMIPDFIKQPIFAEHGHTLGAVAEIFYEFNKRIIDIVHPHVAAVKPQIAFYEQAGWQGIKALQDTILYAKSKGLIVIMDAKRNDIGSTAEAYAFAHLGTYLDHPVFDADLLTVTPYLGSDSITPFLELCSTNNKGIFVLVKTSNPSSKDLQDLEIHGKKIYELMAEQVNAWAQQDLGENGYSAIGAVVGATFPEEAQKLRNLMPKSLFLVPGYGAQGGTADDVVPCFNKDGFGAVVNSSRGIIFAYKDPACTEEVFTQSITKAVLDMKDAITSALRKANKCAW